MEHWLKLELEAAYPTFKTYQALTRHFSKGTYNYFKYGGSIKTNIGAFMANKTAVHYIKLHKRITASSIDAQDFIVANFLANGGKSIWVGAMTHEGSSKTAAKFAGILQDMGGHAIAQLKQETMDRCVDYGEKFSDMIRTDNELILPTIIESYAQKEFDLHTLVCLDNALGLRKLYSEQLANNFIWQSIESDLDKVSGFYRYDQQTAKLKLAKFLKEYW